MNSCCGFLSPLYFQPGAMVPKSSCENCVCTDEQDPVTQTNRIQCLPVQCQTTCQQVSTSSTSMAVEFKQGQCNCFICATQQDGLFYYLFCKVVFRVLVIFAPADLRGHPWKGALRGNDCKPVKV